MDEIPDESIDVILTDPPWNMNKDYGPYKDNLPWPEYWRSMDQCVKEITRVAKVGYFIFTFADNIMWGIKPMVEKHGWQYTQMLVWFHPNGYGAQNPYFWNRRFQPILVFKKLGAPKLKKGHWFTSVITEPSPQSNWKREKKIYSVQHPVALYEKILSRLPGKIMLDPFAGTGASLKAAKRQGWHYIGYEINPECCEKLIKPALKEIDPLFHYKEGTHPT